MLTSPQLGVSDIALICAAAALFAGAGVWLLFFVRRFRDMRLRTLAPETSMWAAVEFQMLSSAGYLELNRFFGFLFLVIASALIGFMLIGIHPA
jgi:hypothetical protein